MSSTERSRTVETAPVEPGRDARACCSRATSLRCPPTSGFRGPVACSAAGITYRQLDYWARTGLVVPEVRGASGSGSQRLYSFRDILMLKVIKRLIDAGISLQQIRTAIDHLRARGVADLTQVTLMSDGVSVFECTSDDEVIDLLRGGQGVFGIALGGVWRSIEGTLSELPAERAAAAEPEPAQDELSQRRQARHRRLSAAGSARHAVDRARLARCWQRPRGRVQLSSTIEDRAGAEGATSPEPLRHQDRVRHGNSGAVR